MFLFLLRHDLKLHFKIVETSWAVHQGWRRLLHAFNNKIQLLVNLKQGDRRRCSYVLNKKTQKTLLIRISIVHRPSEVHGLYYQLWSDLTDLLLANPVNRTIMPYVFMLPYANFTDHVSGTAATTCGNLFYFFLSFLPDTACWLMFEKRSPSWHGAIGDKYWNTAREMNMDWTVTKKITEQRIKWAPARALKQTKPTDLHLSKYRFAQDRIRSGYGRVSQSSDS